ncbi:MAG: hypothetical protein ACP5OO_00630 [Chloroflexia bacterium]
MERQIRPATLLDLVSLGMPPQVSLHLDLVQHLVFPYHPWRGLLTSFLHLGKPSCTLLCRQGGKLLACAQARESRQRGTWEVGYLGSWATGEEACDPWEELLRSLGVEAGRRGQMRILARLPEEEHLELFQRAGFAPFAQEMILLWEGNGRPEVATWPEPQPLQAGALAAVQGLYAGLTPPIVQQVEPREPAFWQVGPGEEAWVWPEQDRVRAYLRCERGGRGTRLEVLLEPAFRQHSLAVLAWGLKRASSPVYLVLRSYQGELLEVARRLGFRPYGEQVLLARSLAVRVEQRQALPGRRAGAPLGAAPSTPSLGKI